MKVFVTGVNGQLGYDCVKELAVRGHEVTGSDIQEECPLPASYVRLDITDPEAVRKTIGKIRPDAVIHCAAWTAVDAAEEPGNREKVFAVNELYLLGEGEVPGWVQRWQPQPEKAESQESIC